MTTPIPDMGVTVADVAEMAHRVQVTANTSPDTARVEAFIDDRTAEIAAMLMTMGVDVTGLATRTTGIGYRLVRRWIVTMSAYDLLRARERVAGAAVPLLESYREEGESLMERIRQRPADLGDEHPTASGDPNLVDSHVTRQSQIDAATDGYGLGAQLAWRGRL